MSLYFKSGFKKEHMQRILSCVKYFKSQDKLHDLHTFSIPYQLRKCIFKTLKIPSYSYEIDSTVLYPFTKFLSKTVQVYMSKKAFVIKIPYEDLVSLSVVIHFLAEHSKSFPIFIDCEFTNQNIVFIQETIKKFPDRKLYFKISNLEFSYIHVENVTNDILYTKSNVLYDRIEYNFPDIFEKDMTYYNEIDGEIKGNIDFQKYFKIYDKNLGILSNNYPFPRCINNDSVVILQ
jgi:hypothetical protein